MKTPWPQSADVPLGGGIRAANAGSSRPLARAKTGSLTMITDVSTVLTCPLLQPATRHVRLQLTFSTLDGLRQREVRSPRFPLSAFAICTGTPWPSLQLLCTGPNTCQLLSPIPCPWRQVSSSPHLGAATRRQTPPEGSLPPPALDVPQPHRRLVEACRGEHFAVRRPRNRERTSLECPPMIVPFSSPSRVHSRTVIPVSAEASSLLSGGHTSEVIELETSQVPFCLPSRAQSRRR